jgi:hypothetical protein
MKHVVSSSMLARRLQGGDRRSLGRSAIEAAMFDGTPAMRARGRKLLTRWLGNAGVSGAVRSGGTRETPCA